jgi:uncharacterized Ntn-hydrolase superfamily protein
MTFSIVARDEDGTHWGVAVASKFLAVGAAVPAASAGVGAIATQAWANLAYRPDGLQLLREGRSAAAVVETLVGADDRGEHRQLGVVDRAGDSAAHTGSECSDWAGHRTGPGYAIQGNILTGPEVVEAAERALLASTGPLARRLLAALEAADAAGGDRRGRQSAALLVVTEGGGYGGGSDVLQDLRVDDHPAPVGELLRLLALHDLYFGKPDPDTLLPLEGELEDEVAGHLTRLGYDTSDFARALESWVGTENYEERHVEGRIDPVVLERMRAQEPPA